MLLGVSPELVSHESRIHLALEGSMQKQINDHT